MRWGILIALTAMAEGSELGRRKLVATFRHPDAPVKVAFFDADATLRVSKLGGVAPNAPDDFEILPGAEEEIRRLNQTGYLVAIVSNQSGIPKYISLEDADLAFRNLVEAFSRRGGAIHYYDFAEHWDDDRKPDVGMARRLEETLRRSFGSRTKIDTSRSFLVGDSAWKTGEVRPDGRPGTHFSNSDRLFAETLGIAFVEPSEFFGWSKYGVESILRREDCVALTAKRREGHP